MAAGSQLTWTYNVTNTGNVALSGVTVSDSDPSVRPFFNGGDDNGNGLLDVGETWTYAAVGTAVVGQYSNTGTASGIGRHGHRRHAGLGQRRRFVLRRAAGNPGGQADQRHGQRQC